MECNMKESHAIFGVHKPKPLRGFPPGKVRLRLRNTEFARGFVRDENGIRHFILQESEGFWEPMPGCEQGRNFRLSHEA
jgi:hypothetical protein